MSALFSILIFPGFLFLAVFSLAGEFIDRKLYARLQNRVGPPWFQPLADFIKLLAKEDVVPTEANAVMFNIAPLFAVAAAACAYLYIPLGGTQALFSFSGDILVVLYLLTIPTLAFFIGAWYSTSVSDTILQTFVLSRVNLSSAPIGIFTILKENRRL